jgi:hypothetical protein
VEADQKKPIDVPKRPTIAELEAILSKEEEQPIEILPNGEVRAVSRKHKPGDPPFTVKPITMRENLGGEYGEVA